MKKAVASVAALTFCLSLSSIALADHHETVTKEEFQEFCKTFPGRWVGKVTWVYDWPGLGKKGESVTAYVEATKIEGGHAILLRFFGGDGSSTSLIGYDAKSKQIKARMFGSDGATRQSVFFKQGKKWVQKGIGSLHDGRADSHTSIFAFSDDGKSLTITGTGEVDGEKTDDQHDVWRRVSK